MKMFMKRTVNKEIAYRGMYDQWHGVSRNKVTSQYCFDKNSGK